MSGTNIDGVPRQAQLQQVLDLSKNMVEQAGRGEWEKIAELERQRRTDMMHALEAPLQEEETQQVRDSLEQLMQLNGQLAAIVKDARDNSVKQYNMLQDGHKATQAYAKVGEQN
ncbi:MAG: flagellar protein FliT [Porticoccaceae bacterium]|nr:flagellar protein FliT [Porticoccaceae bacterium]